jgi:hypothetical protein
VTGVVVSRTKLKDQRPDPVISDLTAEIPTSLQRS